MLDGEETVQIAWGELRWEGARQHAGRTGNRANSLGRASWEKRDSMLDGEEIACGKLRWEGARACWTDRKRWK